jgi:hypothetical protein
VDSTGKRRKLFTMIAAGAGVLLITAVVILVAGFVGVGPSHLPGLPDLHPVQQEVVPIQEAHPQGSPDSQNPEGANPTTGPSQAVPSPTLDTHGNKPTHNPNHPQPTRTK